MKIAISAGHNVYANGYFDNGTRGHGKTEAAEVKETVAILIRLLRAKGHDVLDVTPYNQRFANNGNGSAQKNAHQERANRVNRFKPDLYLDIHLNAGGGTGPETIVYSTRSAAYPWARKITNSIAKKTGLTNRRGVRVRPELWSVHLQPAPSIIVEGAFMDTKKDVDSITPKLYAEAIAEVFEDLRPNYKEDAVAKPNVLHKVQVGAYASIENADNLLKDLEDKGFKGFISTEEVAGSKPSNPKEEISPSKSEYFKIGDAHIIKTRPDNINIEVLGSTLGSKYGVNGTFFDGSIASVGSPNACVFIAMNDGKAISSNAQFNGWKGPPRATVIHQKDKKMSFRQLKDINTIRDVADWAIGGYMVKPYMDFKNEQIPGSINYKTAHTYIGYDKEDNIYLIVKPNHMIREIVPLMDRLKITNAITLDGGGSSQLNHPGGSYKASRRINTAAVLKEV